MKLTDTKIQMLRRMAAGPVAQRDFSTGKSLLPHAIQMYLDEMIDAELVRKDERGNFVLAAAGHDVLNTEKVNQPWSKNVMATRETYRTPVRPVRPVRPGSEDFLACKSFGLKC